MKIKRAFSWKIMVSIFVFLIALFVVGIFYDLQISQYICNEKSIYAMILATFGFLPVSFLTTFAGAGLIKNVFKKGFKVWVKIAILIVGLIAVGFSCYVAYCYLISYEFNYVFVLEKFYANSITIPKWLAYLVLALVEIGSGLFGVLFIDEKKENVLILSCFVILVCGLESGIINLGLKQLWGRPRYRMLNDDSSYLIYFKSVLQPGFISGYTYENTAISSYYEITHDYFKSFPSGHSSDAATAILLFYLPLFNKKASKNNLLRYILLLVGLCFFVNVQLSRIIQGAHYLTDTTGGAMITLAIAWILSLFLNKFKFKRS